MFWVCYFNQKKIKVVLINQELSRDKARLENKASWITNMLELPKEERLKFTNKLWLII